MHRYQVDTTGGNSEAQFFDKHITGRDDRDTCSPDNSDGSGANRGTSFENTLENAINNYWSTLLYSLTQFSGSWSYCRWNSFQSFFIST